MASTVYQIITAKFLSELEGGVIPWRQPWSPDLAPQNFISRKPYRGINSLLLSIASRRFGCPFFATLKQIKRLGGQVRSDEWRRNSLATLWKWVPKENERTGEHRLVPFLRYYRVWNLAQTDRIEWSLPDRRQIDPIEECERIVLTYQNQGGPSIHHEESPHAYYDLIDDSVHIPTLDRFIDSYSYYQVFFHELVHSTGHTNRLNRDLTAERHSRSYAREELTAEIGGAFLLGTSGLSESAPITNSAAYIQHWMQALQDDPRCVVCAASRAQKASDWILGFREESVSEDEVLEEEACHEVV